MGRYNRLEDHAAVFGRHGDRLVGVLTLKDMLKFLSLKLDLEESAKADVRFADVGPQEGRLSQRA